MRKLFVSGLFLMFFVVASFTARAVLLDAVTYDYGEASINHQWTAVTFTETFSSTPLVFAEIQTEEGGHDAQVDLRNITTTGFEMKVEEDRGSDRTWHDKWHKYETIAWLAFDANEIAAGYGVEAGIHNMNQTNHANWGSVSLSESYASTPLVFAQLQTEEGGHTSRMDLQNISTTGFDLRIEEDPGNGVSGGWDGAHKYEDVGYLVIGADLSQENILNGSAEVGNAWTALCFYDDCSEAFTDVPYLFIEAQTENEADTAYTDVRNVTATGFDVRMEELDLAGWDMSHAAETVAWMATGEVIPEEPPEPEEPPFNPADYNVLVIDTDSNLDETIEAIFINAGYNVDFQPSSTIESGVPSSYDLLVWPGGIEPVTDTLFNTALQSSVQAFIDEGKGFIGVCGGAIAGSDQVYLMDYPYLPWDANFDMLGIGTGVIADYDYDWTGYIGGSYDPDLTIETDHPIFGENYVAGDTISMAYRGGPVFVTDPGVEILATYPADLQLNYPDYVSQPAIVTTEYDGNGDGTSGTVVLFSTHPELNNEFMLENAGQWLLE